MDRLDVFLRMLGIIIVAFGVWLYVSSSGIIYPLAHSIISSLAVILALAGLFLALIGFKIE